MKLFDLIKNRKETSLEVLALEEQFAAIGNIADPGEQMILYKGIVTQCYVFDNAMNLSMKSVMMPAGAGLGLLISGGVALAVPAIGLPVLGLGVAGGLLTGLISGGATMNINASYKLALKVRNQAEKEIQKLETQQDPLSFASSPYFDKVMEDFPKLKERFMMASAKATALQKQTQAPQIPSPARKSSGQGDAFRL